MLADQFIEIKVGDGSERSFLKEMLFEAAYWRPGQEQPSLETGLARPDLVFLLEDWGRDGDAAVLAVTPEAQPVGAAWYRFWSPEQHSYGFVSPKIPEMAIAIRAAFRCQGIGHRIMEELLTLAAVRGIEKVSLSVEVDNPALKLYRNHGFEIIARVGNSWTMVANTKVRAAKNQTGKA